MPELTTMPQINRKPLPNSPLTEPVELPVTVAPDPVPTVTVEDPYVPRAKKAEKEEDPLVNVGFKVRQSMRRQLVAIAKDYDTDMTSIVVDILKRELPKIPPRKKR